MVLPDNSDEEAEESKDIQKTKDRSKIYSGHCLRPYPAVRGHWAVDYTKTSDVKLRKSGKSSLRIVRGNFLFRCSCYIDSLKSHYYYDFKVSFEGV